MKASRQESKEKTYFKTVILSLFFVGKLALKQANVLNYFTVVLRVAFLNAFPPAGVRLSLVFAVIDCLKA